MSTHVTELGSPDRLSAVTARRVRALMAEMQMKSATVAGALGLSAPAFSRRRVGDLAFSLDEIEAIARLLGVNPAYLLGFTEDRNPRPAGPDGGLDVVRHQGLEPRTRWCGASRRHLSVARVAEVLPFRPLERAA